MGTGVGKADSGEELASNYLRVNRFKPEFTLNSHYLAVGQNSSFG